MAAPFGPRRAALESAAGPSPAAGAFTDLLAKADLACFLASATDAVIAIDQSQRILAFNRAAEEMFKCPAEEALGTSVERFLPERFRGRHAGHVRRFAETGATRRRMGALGTLRGLRANGEEFPLEASIAQLAAGGSRLLVAVVRDVSERELALVQQQRLAAIVEYSEDAIISKTLQGRITSWNPSAERIYGYSSAEMIGRPIATLQPEDRKGEMDRIHQRVLQGEHVDRFETTRVRKDGIVVSISLSVSPIRDLDGSILGTASISRDITERGRALEAQADLARIVEESLSEIHFFDATTLRFSLANRAAREHLGYSPQALYALTPLDLMSELSPEGFEALLAPLRAGERAGVDFATLYRRKDGGLYPVHVHLEPGRYRGAEGFVARALDISERREAEERQRESERRAHRLEALASISTLTAGIAHDIGAPMTAILGYAEMLQKSLSDPKNRRRAAIIAEQVCRISDLVQTLLNMARPGGRRLVPLDLSEVVRLSLDFYREKLHQHGIAVHVSLEAVAQIAGDADRLEQIFLNLLLNATDAMAEGGDLHVSLASPEEGFVEVRIRDTGAGIPAGALPQIFDAFYTTKARGRGTGLGLMVTKTIVEEHGGHISVRSELGSGTEFAIRFPVAVG